MNIRAKLFALGVALVPTFAQSELAPDPPLDGPEQAQRDLFDQARVGERLTAATLRAAASFKPKADEMFCYRYVKQGIYSALGISLSVIHAYQAAEQLAESPCFVERGTARKQLNVEDAPRGSVLVWGASPKYPSGHISVSMGNGKEVSDRIRPLTSNFGTTVRVFVPRPQCERANGSSNS
ncbi:MAG: hypothetical protein U0931_35795 [Vulcanimicrobiota bacterium]